MAPDDDGRLRRRRTERPEQEPPAVSHVPSAECEGFGGSVLPPWLPFAALLLSRSVSAATNIIPDCDEAFNFWEPLHFLVFGHGFQTWEHSSDNALRSYLYLLLHGTVVWPASWVFGDGRFKFLCFYALRLALGAVSAWVDAQLVHALAESVASGGVLLGGKGEKSQRRERGLVRDGARVGWYALLLLCFCPGPFLASTTFLPSTLSMYSLSWASALFLRGKCLAAVAVAAAGCLLGWPFAALAAGPLVLASFAVKGFGPVFLSGVLASSATFAASVAADWVFYGRVQCSILNLVWYNVAGGGDSALYGVEGPLFYLKNGVLNFAMALPLALALPLLWLAAPRGTRQAYWWTIVAAALPVVLWMGFMSMQAHKEERFLYVVYPLICASAAAALALLPRSLPTALLGSKGAPSLLVLVVKACQAGFLLLTLVLSVARTAAVLTYYSAPMHVYRHLPAVQAPPKEEVTVCVGVEWHRFPSHFFLPSAQYRLAFLDEGFRGLLPFPFNASLGGTASAPAHFNRENKAAPGQFVEEDSVCSYRVELQSPLQSEAEQSDDSWTILYQTKFLDAERSPMPYRAFLIPRLSGRRVKFGNYRLLERRKAETV